MKIRKNINPALIRLKEIADTENLNRLAHWLIEREKEYLDIYSRMFKKLKSERGLSKEESRAIQKKSVEMFGITESEEEDHRHYFSTIDSPKIILIGLLKSEEYALEMEQMLQEDCDNCFRKYYLRIVEIKRENIKKIKKYLQTGIFKD